MTAAAYDVAAVRALYPALAEGISQLDGPGGTQVALPVADAVAGALRSAVSNRHGPFRSSRRADEIVEAARAAVADLLGGIPEGVVLGPNMTSLTFTMSRALAAQWRPGDEIVVSRLDHDANVRPWVIAAERAGVSVRWADIDPGSGELQVEQYSDLVTERTRLVAVTAASNAIGTRPDVPAIARIAHDAGALVYVDGVHATPHVPVDVAELGADFYVCSSYKFGGPHLGALVADPELLGRLRPDKLVPSPDSVPDRFETGTPPFALHAGLTATVDHIADLASIAGVAAVSGDASRRERVLASMRVVAEYEAGLLERLLAGLRSLGDAVTCYGNAGRRTPTVMFRLAGHAPEKVATRLGERDIAVWHGDYYARELVERLGLMPDGGVRVGLVHYTTAEEVDAFVAALAEMV